MGILSRNVVALKYELDALPFLRCPISGHVIIRPRVDGEDDLIDYSRIDTVIFSIFTFLDECDYFREDMRLAIDALRKSLGEEEDDFSDHDILEDHFDDWPSNVMIVQLTLDRMHGQCQYIGIDLGPEDRG